MSTLFIREATIRLGPARGPRGSRVATSADVVAFIRELLRDEIVEHFVAVGLDAKRRPIAWTTIAIGSVSACPVSPADVLRFALVAAAPAVVVAHNHPSGDPAPSPEDLILTERLVLASKHVGIQILDHVIAGEDGHFSFLDAGLLGPRSR